MEFGGYLLNVAKNTTRARARKGEAQGVLSYQKATGIFDNPHIYIGCGFKYILLLIHWESYYHCQNLGCGFKYYSFSPLLGEMIQFD